MRCFAEDSEWHGVGCWLRGLECTVDAWQGSSFWAYSLPTCQLGRLWNLPWQFFKTEESVQGEIVSTFLTTRTSGRVLSDKQSGSRKRKEGLYSEEKPISILQEPLWLQCTFWAFIPKFRPKEIWITNFSLGGAARRLAGYNSKWYFTGLPIRHTVMSWIFRSEAIFLGCQPIQDH